MRRFVLVLMFLTSLVLLAQDKPAPYLDTTLPAAARAHDLVGRMTLDEKGVAT